MNDNPGKTILSHYEKYLGNYSDVKIYNDENATIQFLWYDHVFADCKTIISFGLSKYLKVDNNYYETVLVVDSEYDVATKLLANALFYIIQNGVELSPGSYIEGIANVDESFSSKYNKKALYFSMPYCFPDEFHDTGVCHILLAFFITEDELMYLKKYGCNKFEDDLESKDCDIFEIARK